MLYNSLDEKRGFEKSRELLGYLLMFAGLDRVFRSGMASLLIFWMEKALRLKALIAVEPFLKLVMDKQSLVVRTTVVACSDKCYRRNRRPFHVLLSRPACWESPAPKNS